MDDNTPRCSFKDLPKEVQKDLKEMSELAKAAETENETQEQEDPTSTDMIISSPAVTQPFDFEKLPIDLKYIILDVDLKSQKKIAIEIYWDRTDKKWKLAKESRTVHPYLITAPALRKFFLRRAKIVSTQPTVYYHPDANVIFLAHLKGESRLPARAMDNLGKRACAFSIFKNLTEIALSYHTSDVGSVRPWSDYGSKCLWRRTKEAEGARSVLGIAERVYKVLPNLKNIIIVVQPSLVAEGEDRSDRSPPHQASVERVELSRFKTRYVPQNDDRNGFETWMDEMASSTWYTYLHKHEYTYTIPPFVARLLDRRRLSQAEVAATKRISGRPVVGMQEDLDVNQE